MQQFNLEIIVPLISIPCLLLALWRIGLRRLKTYHSPLLGKIEIYKKYNGEKLLTINSYAQGISTEQKSIQKSYWYCIAREAVKFCQNKKNPQVLMLGLGANTIPTLIAGLNPAICQTIVEIDKEIIQACRTYFKLDSLPNYQLVRTDAYQLAEDKNAFGRQFNVLIVDIFTGKPPYVSLKSNKPNFIQKLLPWIKTDGMIIFNRPGNTEESRTDSQKLKNYLDTLFKNTTLFDLHDPRGYRNNVIVASFKKSPS